MNPGHLRTVQWIWTELIVTLFFPSKNAFCLLWDQWLQRYFTGVYITEARLRTFAVVYLGMVVYFHYSGEGQYIFNRVLRCSGGIIWGFLPFLLMSSSLRLTKLAMVVGRLDKSLSGMLSFFKAWQLKSCYGNTERKQRSNIGCWQTTEIPSRKVESTKAQKARKSRSTSCCGII